MTEDEFQMRLESEVAARRQVTAQLDAVQRDFTKQVADLKAKLGEEIKQHNNAEELLAQASALRDDYKSQLAQANTARAAEKSASEKAVKELRDNVFLLNKEKVRESKHLLLAPCSRFLGDPCAFFRLLLSLFLCPSRFSVLRIRFFSLFFFLRTT